MFCYLNYSQKLEILTDNNNSICSAIKYKIKWSKILLSRENANNHDKKMLCINTYFIGYFIKFKTCIIKVNKENQTCN